VPNLRPELGTASLAISQSVFAFTAFLPNFVEVGKSSPDDIRSQVRLGETAAVITALGIGGILAWLAGSPVPLLIAGLVSAILIYLYESAMRKEV
jgi:NhaP-type Na+/H+ or K+/H+ antiporter